MLSGSSPLPYPRRLASVFTPSIHPSLYSHSGFILSSPVSPPVLPSLLCVKLSPTCHQTAPSVSKEIIPCVHAFSFSLAPPPSPLSASVATRTPHDPHAHAQRTAHHTARHAEEQGLTSALNEAQCMCASSTSTSLAARTPATHPGRA
jgi:hypothetical protein